MGGNYTGLERPISLDGAVYGAFWASTGLFVGGRWGRYVGAPNAYELKRLTRGYQGIERVLVDI